MCLSNNTIFQGPISRFAMCQLIIYWPCKHEIQFERILIFFSFTEKNKLTKIPIPKISSSKQHAIDCDSRLIAISNV